MSSRGSMHIRTKVVALLVSLVALWAFAAFVTLREGLNLLSITTVDSGIGSPSEPLVAALQQERRLTAVYLGGRTTAQRNAMLDQRARTDQARNTFEEKARASAVQVAINPVSGKRLSETFERLNDLAGVRAAIDAGRVNRDRAAEVFTGVVDSVFYLYGSLAEFDDKEIAKDIRTLIALFRAQEMLAREDALLAGVLAAGSFQGTEHSQFVRLVGTQQFLYATTVLELPAAQRTRYEQLISGPEFTRHRALEDRVVLSARPGQPLPVTSARMGGRDRAGVLRVERSVDLQQ